MGHVSKLLLLVVSFLDIRELVDQQGIIYIIQEEKVKCELDNISGT